MDPLNPLSSKEVDRSNFPDKQTGPNDSRPYAGLEVFAILLLSVGCASFLAWLMRGLNMVQFAAILILALLLVIACGIVMNYLDKNKSKPLGDNQ